MNDDFDVERIYNTKSKKHIFYYKKTKKEVLNKKLIDYIKSLKIPPAYKNVNISSKKNKKILAIGTDSKNRNQYIYNKDYLEKQKVKKFKDLYIFGKKIKAIRKNIKENLLKIDNNNDYLDNKECVISLILYLIDKCNFRVGSEKYKHLYNTYGVTTLNNSHFKENKNSIEIEFVGKKGVVNKSIIKNKLVCALLKKICVKNRGEYIFTYKDNKNNKYRITEIHINNYLKKYNKLITVKMFRTWSSNYILLKEILNYPLPNSESEAKRNISKIIKKAAFFLHHTSNVSRKSYMNTEIIDLYLNNYNGFKNLIEKFRKNNGELPNLDRLLNLILFSL